MSFVNINGRDIPVGQYRNDWALALMSRGIIVKLSLSRWRAETSLDPQELGLNFANDDVKTFIGKYITFGKEKLLPPFILNEINTIERMARDNLKQFSFDTVWGKFVPYNAFERWEERNNECKSMWMEFAQKLSTQYGSILDIVKEDYRKLAKDVWARMYVNGGEATEAFITNFVNKIVDKVPNSVEIAKSFKYDTIFFAIPMPSILQKDLAEIQDIQRNQEMKDFSSVLAQRTQQKIAEQYAERKSELIDGFLSATVGSMRQYVEDLCQNVLDSIGKFNASDISKLQQVKILNMIDKVRLINFYDDKQINDLLSELQQEVIKVKGERDKDAIVTKLSKIVQISSEEFRPENFNPTTGYMEL